MATQSEKTTAMWLHLSQFSTFIIPFGNVIVPLVLWFVNKDKMKYVDVEGKVYLNALFSYIIYALVCALLSLILIGIVLAFALGILWIVEVIRAAIRTNNGEAARNYVLAINFFKV